MFSKIIPNNPIISIETNVLYGLGKHGDSALTRANKRSPWDTLHPGRKWAVDTIEDARSVEQVQSDLDRHFAVYKPLRDSAELLEAFFAELRQS